MSLNPSTVKISLFSKRFLWKSTSRITLSIFLFWAGWYVGDNGLGIWKEFFSEKSVYFFALVATVVVLFSGVGFYFQSLREEEKFFDDVPFDKSNLKRRRKSAEFNLLGQLSSGEEENGEGEEENGEGQDSSIEKEKYTEIFSDKEKTEQEGESFQEENFQERESFQEERFERSVPHSKSKTSDFLSVAPKLLDQLLIQGILIDSQGKVLHLNPPVYKQLESCEQWLPVSLDQVVGSFYYDLHFRLAGLKEFLQSPDQFPHNTEIDFGQEILESTTVPLHNEQGKFLGAAVLWKSVTRERNQERWEHVVEQQIKTSSGELVLASKELQTLSQGMKTLSGDTTTQAQELSSFANQASQRINSLAIAIEQTSATTASIADQVEHGSEIAKKAMTQSQDTSQTISEVNSMTGQIRGMVTKIENIMQQTRMLALNATLEAARAGDNGLRFSVIADEVRILSQMTGDVTTEIRQMTEQMMEKIPSSVDAIQAVQDVIDEMNNITLSINASMSEQSNTMQEMSQNMHLADENTQEIVTLVTNVLSDSQVAMEHSDKGIVAAKEIHEITESFEICARRFSTSERIVTADDVVRMMTILNFVVDAIIEEKAPTIYDDIMELTPMSFQDKVPTHVLKKTKATADVFFSILNLDANSLPPYEGTVTPNQVFNYVSKFLELANQYQQENLQNPIEAEKKAKPVEGMNPNNVYAMIDLANRKLKLFQQVATTRGAF